MSKKCASCGSEPAYVFSIFPMEWRRWLQEHRDMEPVIHNLNVFLCSECEMIADSLKERRRIVDAGRTDVVDPDSLDEERNEFLKTLDLDLLEDEPVF